MFPNSDLEMFKPDIIYICTCVRNIIEWPTVIDSKDDVEVKDQQFLQNLQDYGIHCLKISLSYYSK